MKRNEPIKAVMSGAPRTVQRGERLSIVRQLLSDGEFHHVPVLDGDSVVGMISSRDMLSLSFNTNSVDVRSLDAMLDHQFSLEEVMQKEVISISTDSHVKDAADILAKGKVHSVVVVDEGKKLAGIVTSTDVIRYLVRQY